MRRRGAIGSDYDFFNLLVMKPVLRKYQRSADDLDTSRDTDYKAVRRFAVELADSLDQK